MDIASKREISAHKPPNSNRLPPRRRAGPTDPTDPAPHARSTGGLPRLQRKGCLPMDYDDHSDDELTGVAATREIYATFG